MSQRLTTLFNMPCKLRGPGSLGGGCSVALVLEMKVSLIVGKYRNWMFLNNKRSPKFGNVVVLRLLERWWECFYCGGITYAPPPKEKKQKYPTNACGCQNIQRVNPSSPKFYKGIALFILGRFSMGCKFGWTTLQPCVVWHPFVGSATYDTNIKFILEMELPHLVEYCYVLCSIQY